MRRRLRRAVAALWLGGAAIAGLSLGPADGAAQSRAPEGCEAVATVIYERCRVAHVYACRSFPNGRVVYAYEGGVLVEAAWLEAGFDLRRLAIPHERFVGEGRLVSGLAAREILARARLRGVVERVFENSARVGAARTGLESELTMLVRELEPFRIDLASGAERVRRFSLRLDDSLTGLRLGEVLFAPSVGVLIGEAYQLSDGRLIERRPHAVLRPGDAGFLSLSGAIECAGAGDASQN